MISVDFVNSLLQQYCESEAGKTHIAAHISNNHILDRHIMEYADQLKQSVYDSIVSVIPSFQLENIIINPVERTKDGKCNITLSFDQASLFRPSLVQDRNIAQKWDRFAVLDGMYGTDNIVLQFLHGWKAKNIVYGERNGSKCISRKTYNPYSDFIQDSVNRILPILPEGVNIRILDPYV